MKVEYIEPFVRAACNVLESVAECEVKAGSLSLLGNTFATASTNIAAQVDGELVGEVVYSMSGSTAQTFAGLITRSQTYGFGRITGSGLAELGSLLAGKTRCLLEEKGYFCKIGSPLVFQGLNVEFSTSVPALGMYIDTDAGQVEISVAVRDGQQN